MEWSRESYAHYYAKEVVVGWLQSKWDRLKDTYAKEITFGHLSWKIDRRYGPGLKLEYPLLRSKSGAILGLSSEWSRYPDINRPPKSRITESNTTESLTTDSHTTESPVVSHTTGSPEVLVVFDIVISELGKPKYAIEIVHTHVCTEAKRRILEDLPIEVYELSASWVMSQLRGRIPTCIPLVKLSRRVKDPP